MIDEPLYGTFVTVSGTSAPVERVVTGAAPNVVVPEPLELG
jgi:hypothetical protein